MTEGERLKYLRKSLGIRQGDFAEKISTTQGHISDIENGRKSLSERTLKLICLEDWNGKKVSENWLRTGEGEMFLPVLEEDEMALYVSELLEDEGDNPLYTIIKEVMHTYSELSPKSQEVIRDAAEKLLENLRKTDREG